MPARQDYSFVLPGSCFAEAKLPYVIASARLYGMKNLTKTSAWRYPQKYISIDRRYFCCALQRIWRQSMRKKLANVFVEFCDFTQVATEMFCKKGIVKIFCKIPRKTPFTVSLETFKSAILLKRDANLHVFLWMFRNFY